MTSIEQTGQFVGYVRVSTVDQNASRQLEGISLHRTFTDQASGAGVVLRPQLQAALSYVREGDTLIVHSMDRLARNLIDLWTLVNGLTGRGVNVRFVKENLTFTGKDSPISNLLLSVVGAVSEFERQLIRERQREGIELAKREGRYKGRPRALTAAEVREIKARAAAGESKADLAQEFGVSRVTVYNCLPRTSKPGEKQLEA